MEELPMRHVPNPCAKDCPNSSSTCHKECAKYAAFVACRRKLYAQRERNHDVAGVAKARFVRISKYYNTNR